MSGRIIRRRCACHRLLWAIEVRDPAGNVYSMLVCHACDSAQKVEVK